jgi:hypothetical protein
MKTLIAILAIVFATLGATVLAQETPPQPGPRPIAAARQIKPKKTIQTTPATTPDPQPKLKDPPSPRPEFVKEAQLALFAAHHSEESKEAKADARSKIDLATVDAQTPAEEQAAKTLESILIFHERLTIEMNTFGMKLVTAARWVRAGEDVEKDPQYRATLAEGGALVYKSKRCYYESTSGFKKGDFALPESCQ